MNKLNNSVSFNGRISYASDLHPRLVALAERSHMSTILGDHYDAKVESDYGICTDGSIIPAVQVIVKRIGLSFADKIKLLRSGTSTKEHLRCRLDCDPITETTFDDMAKIGMTKIKSRLAGRVK